MVKANIEKFIKQVHLNGIIDEAKFTVANKELSTKVMTSDRKFFAAVSLGNFDISDTQVGVLSLKTLKQMLGAVGDDVQVAVEADTNDPTYVRAMVFSDDKTEVSFMAASLDTLSAVPNLRSLPTFGVEITLTEDFIDQFLAARSSLSTSDLFTLVMNKKKNRMDMVLGYSKNNSNRISLVVPTVAGKDTVKNPISFSAAHLEKVLNANPNAKDSVLKVSEDGLASVEIKDGDFQSQYYMVKIDVED